VQYVGEMGRQQCACAVCRWDGKAAVCMCSM